jgi:hypothetical protein
MMISASTGSDGYLSQYGSINARTLTPIHALCAKRSCGGSDDP